MEIPAMLSLETAFQWAIWPLETQVVELALVRH